MILDNDRELHGDDAGEPDIDEFVTDDKQQGVDDGIERAMRRGTAPEEQQEDPDADDEHPSRDISINPVQSSPSPAASGSGADGEFE